MTAIEEIAAERKRQIEVEGWMPEHDDGHGGGDLAYAAASYALCSAGHYPDPIHYMPGFWPWAPDRWKPQTPRRDLIRAAALIVAEIERLDRAPTHATQTGGGGADPR